ncbi:MAG: radical SAM protein [Alphaproteobacteria bacterium]
MSVAVPVAKPLDPAKFRDPDVTAKGEKRASVPFRTLKTLWFNTGTLCNLTCRNCYIESSPRNDRLVYITAAEVEAFLDEIAGGGWPTDEIGFTGGEPFMNPDIIPMLEAGLARGFRVLVLTNAMRPMMKLKVPLLDLKERFPSRLVVRVSLDHYTEALHEVERGYHAWAPTLEGLKWLARNGFTVHVAGRTCWGEAEARARLGYARLFAEHGIPIDARNPVTLVLFPEMDERLDVPEITESCWGILGVEPDSIMCASSRMVVKRKGEGRAKVVSCTLLPYDERFEMGHTLAEAAQTVKLNHPHCARFCVLGGGSCSKG